MMPAPLAKAGPAIGGGRILHATQRDGVDGVVEEDEPAALRERRRALVRLGPASDLPAGR